MGVERSNVKGHLRVATNRDALAEVWQWLEGLLKPTLPPQLWCECQLLVTEAFVNVVEHAHQHLSPHTPIDLEVELSEGWLIIRIWDLGQPFDLKQKLASKLAMQPDLYAENGRGLLLMNQLTNELEYDRTDDQRNCLVMRKQV